MIAMTVRIPDIQFAHPLWGYLLLAIPLMAILFWSLFRYRVGVLDKFFKSMVLHRLLLPRSRGYFILQCLCICLSWVFAVVALMGPIGSGEYVSGGGGGGGGPRESGNSNARQRQYKSHEVAFILDVSASMTVPDALRNRRRLDYAKDIIDGVVSRLKGERVSLYVFTSEVTQIVPPTLDYLYLRLMLRSVSINEGNNSGTNLFEVMQAIRKRFLDANARRPPDMMTTLIVLSDGGDTSLEAAEDERKRSQREGEVVNLSDSESIRVVLDTVGMGSKEGANIPNIVYQGKPVHSALQDDILKKMSGLRNGRYYFANAYSPLILEERIAETIQQVNVVSRSGGTGGGGGSGGSGGGNSGAEEGLLYHLFFQYPLALALLFLAGSMMIPDVNKIGNL